MGRRWRNRAKVFPEDENEGKISIIFVDSSDDELANKDLSLEIVEKAKKREEKRKRIEDLEATETLAPIVCKEKEVVEVKKKKKNSSKKKKIEESDEVSSHIIILDIEKSQEETKETASAEKEVVTLPENTILRKLLRGPRYFDPPSGLEACYNCGEEGHLMNNCTLEKHKKPCYVCGKFGHDAKHCTQGQDCYTCKKRGHIAKHCPKKEQGVSNNEQFCLRCGEMGHDMLSCRNDYDFHDMKEMQCYVCKSFGHLCCVNTIDMGPKDISCYNCSESGHTGLGCAKPRKETSATRTPTLCYKCGKEGHFARGCIQYNTEIGQNSMEPSTPTIEFGQKTRGFKVRSVPYDFRIHKLKNMNREGRRVMSSVKHTGKRGWITDDPGDIPNGKNKLYGWGFPRTPIKNGQHFTSASSINGKFSNYHRSYRTPSSMNVIFSDSSSRMVKAKHLPDTPGSYTPLKIGRHAFSASRFGVFKDSHIKQYG